MKKVRHEGTIINKILKSIRIIIIPLAKKNRGFSLYANNNDCSFFSHQTLISQQKKLVEEGSFILKYIYFFTAAS